MALNTKPKGLSKTPSDAAFDRVLAKASDTKALAGSEPGERKKGVVKGSKRQITHTLNLELLNQIDQVADNVGVTRTAIINMALHHALKSNIFG